MVDLVFLELLLQVRNQQWVRSLHQVWYLRIPIVVMFQILLLLELVHSLLFGSDPKQQSQHSLPWNDHLVEDPVVVVVDATNHLIYRI